MDGSRILFVVAALVVLIHAWRGWRAGVVRQVVSLVALVVAGAAAFFGRELLVPVLRPLGLPEHPDELDGGEQIRKVRRTPRTFVVPALLNDIEQML